MIIFQEQLFYFTFLSRKIRKELEEYNRKKYNVEDLNRFLKESEKVNAIVMQRLAHLKLKITHNVWGK